MFSEIQSEIQCMPEGAGKFILDLSEDIRNTLLGRECKNVNSDALLVFWKIVCKYVSRSYWNNFEFKERSGLAALSEALVSSALHALISAIWRTD